MTVLKMYPIILLVFFATAYAQLQLNGTCDFSRTSSTNNITSFVGTWYKFSRIENTLESGNCSTITIIPVIENQVVTSANISNREVVSGKAVYKNGSVTGLNLNNGVITVTYTDGSSYDYMVLETTERNYMVLYSCNYTGTTKSVWAWKLSANATITAAGINATDAVVATRSDLANATWTDVFFTKDACKLNAGIDLYASPFFILIGLALVKL